MQKHLSQPKWLEIAIYFQSNSVELNCKVCIYFSFKTTAPCYPPVFCNAISISINRNYTVILSIVEIILLVEEFQMFWNTIRFLLRPSMLADNNKIQWKFSFRWVYYLNIGCSQFFFDNTICFFLIQSPVTLWLVIN